MIGHGFLRSCRRLRRTGIKYMYDINKYIHLSSKPGRVVYSKAHPDSQKQSNPLCAARHPPCRRYSNTGSGGESSRWDRWDHLTEMCCGSEEGSYEERRARAMIFKAHRLLYHSTLGWTVIKKKIGGGAARGGRTPAAGMRRCHPPEPVRALMTDY